MIVYSTDMSLSIIGVFEMRIDQLLRVLTIIKQDNKVQKHMENQCCVSFHVILYSVLVRCYGTTKSFILKTHRSHDKIIILLN